MYQDVDAAVDGDRYLGVKKHGKHEETLTNYKN